MSYRTLMWVSLLLAGGTLSGCAGMDFTTLPGLKDGHRTDAFNAQDAKAEGFRYLEVAPFLFVHADGKGGVSSEVVWLPNPNRVFSVHPYSRMASNDVTLKFTNGTLDEASSTVDETVVPTAILNAVASSGLLKFSAANKIPEPNVAAVPIPYLFSITFDNDTQEVVLKGGPIGPEGFRIKVSLLTQGVH